MMTGNDYAALVKDIRRTGLRDPIVLFEGKILDGRNRYRACLDAGIEPRFDIYAGPDAMGFVISTNVRRRQLNDGQKALAGARLALLKQGHRKSNTASAVSQVEAAQLLGTSVDSIQRARLVLENGELALVNAVELGQISVSKAATTLSKKDNAMTNMKDLFSDLKFTGSREAEEKFNDLIKAAVGALKELDALIVRSISELNSFSPKRLSRGRAEYHGAVVALVQSVRDRLALNMPNGSGKTYRAKNNITRVKRPHVSDKHQSNAFLARRATH